MVPAASTFTPCSFSCIARRMRATSVLFGGSSEVIRLRRGSAAASVLCGFESDGAICDFSAGCGASEDADQCRINCEMGTTVNCYDQAAVDCLYTAAQCTASCTDLTACGWIL